MIDLYKNIKSIQKELISNENLKAMINDIRKYLSGEQNNDEYQTNQYFIRMK